MSPSAAARTEGFGDLVRAEWTKLHTVSGWVVGAALVVVVTVAFSLAAPGPKPVCPPTVGCPVLALGPNGEAVADTFYFVHRTLAGDGTVTARVSSLTGVRPSGLGIRRGQASGDLTAELAGARPDLQPWAKAGLIVTPTLRAGAPYAAVMVTGGHGVRFQYNYTHDVAAPSRGGGAPTWLRLMRSGDTVVAFASIDGGQWTRVGSVGLAGLGTDVQIGLFVASPQYAHLTLNLGFAVSSAVTPTVATAGFDRVAVTGRTSSAWVGTSVGRNAAYPALPGRFTDQAGRFTVSGSGDIAPQVAGVQGGGLTIDAALHGTFAGLIVAIVLAVAVASSEDRHGLLTATLSCSPRRGRALTAKMLVIGLVVFAAGSAGTATALAVGVRFFKVHHILMYPTALVTDARVVVGTGLFMALAAVATSGVSLAVRGAPGALVAALGLLILPDALVGVLPAPLGGWLLRVSPAAAMAIKQVGRRYPQVAGMYTPANGYFPLGPWLGLSVLAGYTAIALAVALVAWRRRDA